MAIAPIGSSPGALPASPASAAPARAAEVPFARVIQEVLAGAGAQQVQADQAVRELAMGRADSIHNVMLAVAKADLTFRLILEIRNRLTEAYLEIMRMQV
jgi:flagellar hook-basal body complex protein FliE